MFCELQGRENKLDDLMGHRSATLSLLMSHSLTGLSIRFGELLYPPGSGYRSKPGGLMDDIRVLTPEKGDDCTQTALASLIFFQSANTIRTTTSLTIWLS